MSTPYILSRTKYRVFASAIRQSGHFERQKRPTSMGNTLFDSTRWLHKLDCPLCVPKKTITMRDLHYPCFLISRSTRILGFLGWVNVLDSNWIPNRPPPAAAWIPVWNPWIPALRGLAESKESSGIQRCVGHWHCT